MALEFGFVLALAIVYGTSYLLKFLERYEIPILAVEILAGIIFGSYLGIVHEGSPGYDFLLSLAAFGLLLIMFDAGLELDPAMIRNEPRTVGILGVATFVFPFLSGVGLGLALGLSTFAAFLVGVTISTTSLGLVYPLLENFGMITTDRGQLVLSVTVLNDILSVVALAYGIALTSGRPVEGAAAVTGALVFFFVVVPVFLTDHLSALMPDRLQTNPVKFGVFFAVALAWLLEQAGIHAILGGFFAGLVIAEVTHEGHEVEKAMKPVVDLAAPVFFFFVGMQFQIRSLDVAAAWLVAGVVALGLGAKLVGAVVGGLVARVDRDTTLLLASVMPGRLSISVAAAEIGLSRGLISGTLYDSFIVLSTLSVFLASLLFRQFADQDATGGEVEGGATGDPGSAPQP